MVGVPPDWAVTTEWVQLVEDLGFDSFWVRDHPARAPEEAWTTLAALAMATKRIRLGTLATCVYYRSPLLLARVAADVDRLSHGRLVLGLGCGYDEREFEQLGIPFPPLKERQETLEETIEVVTGLWGETPFTFHGRHLRITDGRVHPGPVQSPRVPILIAGGGETITLRQVARYADMANFGALEAAGGAASIDDIRRKYAALSRHCAALGRPDASVIRSHFGGVAIAPTIEGLHAKLNALPERWRNFPGLVAGTPREAIAQYRALIAAGVEYFTHGAYDAETLRLLAEQVIPEVRLMGPEVSVRGEGAG
jgi:alkanesulfonate monooxygenase SsuD/methylene tetrahydromethanopterin reductase-like flavin-dependent oxidoreductase (luciferase family)